ncbi:MAG: hypothetical protein DYG89_44725 [Caldilinea sp. CFX5]|nr:hypothetical protein [Caldilinea sp. CFX5]
MRRNFLLFAMLLSIIVLGGSTVVVLAQSSDISTEPEKNVLNESLDLTAHQVEYSDNSVTIKWATVSPQQGWVEYGFSPDNLSNVVYDDLGGDAKVTEHRVTIQNLSPRTAIYYAIVSGGVRNTKSQRPFVAVTNQPLITSAAAASSEPQPFFNDTLGLSFIVPTGWNAQAVAIEGGEDPIIEVGDDSGERGSFFIFRSPNPDGLIPEAWLAAHRSDYSATLTNVLGRTNIGIAQALIIGELPSCDAASLLLALVGNDSYMYSITYSGVKNRTSVPEFATIVGSIRFGPEPTIEWQPLSMELATLPPPMQEEQCTQVSAAETTAARKCAGAAMYIPSNGIMKVPWNCYNNDLYCSPYSSNTTQQPFTLPHRGLDIFGSEESESVYATHKGKAFKLVSYAIRLEFDPPYQGRAYYGHMANSNGTRDYRTFTTTNVSAGALLGKTGNYGTGSAGPHLHVSYFLPTQNDFSWPTFDPTKFLSAKNLVWYPGWTYRNDPITCSSSSSDSFESDNFYANAKSITVSGAAQRHDFHAPGDEDWVKFSATAGYGYRIMTSNLASFSDTYVYLYSTNGTTLLGENDDADGSVRSRLDWIAPTSGTYYAKIKHFDWSGYEPYTPMATYEVPVYGANTNYDLSIVTNLALQRPAYATSSSSGFPPDLANDGRTTTRWSSACRWPWDQTDWWWVDLGANTSFNEIYINFETAYATVYEIHWWNDGDAFTTGRAYTSNSSGLKRHNVGVQQARYLGILMKQRYWQYCNYSLWEVSTYRTPSTTVSAAELSESVEPDAILQVPENDLVHLPPPDLVGNYHTFLPFVTH